MLTVISLFMTFKKIGFFRFFGSSNFENPKFRSTIFLKWGQNKVAYHSGSVRTDKISHQNFSATLIWCSHMYPQIFLQKSKNLIFTVGTVHTRSYSGWVPMTHKVLPSKSSESEEFFQYLWHRHISHSSGDIYTFVQKLTPVVSYI